MDQEDEEFANTDAGASQTEPTNTSRLKNGSLVMMKGFPCKVTEVSTAKPGKHGSAKVILKGRDILTAKTYECTYHAGDMVDAPITSREEYTMLESLYHARLAFVCVFISSKMLACTSAY